MTDELEEKCSTLCYPTVKPLLNYVGKCHQNNELMSQLQDKVHEQEFLINQYKMENDRLKVQIKENLNAAEFSNQLEQALERNRMVMGELDAELKKLRTPDSSKETISDLSEEVTKINQGNSEHENIAEEEDLPASCSDIEDANGVKHIRVPGFKSILVLCDSTSVVPAWTVVLRNQGDENFNRNWTEYKNGFGDLNVSFFIGLEALYQMTRSQPHEMFLVVDFKKKDPVAAQFDNFVIGGESEDYRLKSIGSRSGAEILFLEKQLGSKFTTYDRNNGGTETNFAIQNEGGWWYSKYSDGSFTSLLEDTEIIARFMMIRRKSSENRY
ncbi:angiopoietin-related protein 1-like isoform X2 [Drosophila ficusphila]|nr:angiopoietin-related protein 1-like isoform X2 [Drosophila ficusphila]